ncbi:MAG: hypothetical protein NZ958_04545 [Bacteroidia bacterium]|nr:hypothetical protein [Bacteroidia bacterium]MDW8089750.1 hypothetical protein [Bacteroidia bacterium]
MHPKLIQRLRFLALSVVGLMGCGRVILPAAYLSAPIAPMVPVDHQGWRGYGGLRVGQLPIEKESDTASGSSLFVTGQFGGVYQHQIFKLEMNAFGGYRKESLVGVVDPYSITTIPFHFQAQFMAVPSISRSGKLRLEAGGALGVGGEANLVQGVPTLSVILGLYGQVGPHTTIGFRYNIGFLGTGLTLSALYKRRVQLFFATLPLLLAIGIREGYLVLPWTTGIQAYF